MNLVGVLSGVSVLQFIGLVYYAGKQDGNLHNLIQSVASHEERLQRLQGRFERLLGQHSVNHKGELV